MQGATGFHCVDGDLSTYIDACTTGLRFNRYGLRGCALDVHTPGNYSLSFFLSQALSLPSNAVRRTIVVHPACPLGEAPCRDLSTCSTSGFCFDGLATALAQPNTPPTLYLRSNEPSTVYIPRGTVYDVCARGSQSVTGLESAATSASLCESGPVTYDSNGGYITERVLACPPTACLTFGCPGARRQLAASGSMCRGDIHVGLCILFLSSTAAYHSWKTPTGGCF